MKRTSAMPQSAVAMCSLRSICASRAWSALWRPPHLAVRCSASKASTLAARRSSERVAKEVAEYWQVVLDTSVDKTTARALLPNIDVNQILGLPASPSDAVDPAASPAAAAAAAASSGSDEEGEPGEASSSSAAASGRRGGGVGALRKGRPPLFSYFKGVKKQFPKSVALVRVGEFYEAVGIDAVLLVQHAGLNPMGSGNPPRAGCPRQNLRRTVADLVAAGLSVVVCEETPEPYAYGSMRTKQKQRFVAAVVTPANPHLLHGLVDEGTDFLIETTPPLLAVVPKVGGYTVAEVAVELGTVTVMEGLTEDAVFARLHEGGLVPPLFLHVPAPSTAADRRLSEGSYERVLEQRVSSVFGAQFGMLERYSDPDWLAGLLTRVRTMLNLPASEEFTIIQATTRDRPRPLYYSTALNLGLHKARGQPCLLDYILPPGSPLPARHWLRRLLLLPPPPATAVAVHRVGEILRGLNETLPVFPLIPAANVVLKLRTRETNDVFFRELGELCAAVGDLLSRAGLHLPSLAASLLEVACREMGVALSKERLREGCEAALAAIHRVVDHDRQLSAGDDSWLPGDVTDCSIEDVRSGMIRLAQANEGPCRGKVRDDVMAEQWEEIGFARERVQRELEAAFGPVLEAHQAAREPAKSRPSVFYDSVNNALWIKIPKGSAASKAASHLEHPHDRNGRVESSAYATHGLQSALDDYRRACYEASAAVRAHLRALAVELQALQTQLVCAATIGVSASALTAHTREALRRGWCLPTQGFPADGPPPPPGPQDELDLFEMDGMWPYWLDGWDTSTVENSLSLQGMALLTGPNMAGKSTILRSVCAVALLGACGLHVPAAAATVPYFDAFMLRNFSSDSPLEGRSAFAVEMTEMRYVLEDVTPRSLVLVDELGKGTEVRAGASLAGALVEELDRARCRGIFATHLHALLDLTLELDNTEFLMMEVATVPIPLEELGKAYSSSNGSNGGSAGGGASSSKGGAPDGQGPSLLGMARQPTWRIVPGVSTESMALDVARRCRLPAGVVARAAQLYDQLQPMALRPLEAAAEAEGVAEAGSAAAQEAAGQEQAAPARRRTSRAAGDSSSSSKAGSGGNTGGGAGSQWTLEAAAATLQEVAQDALGRGSGQLEAGAEAEAAQLQLQYVLRGQAPGPATVGSSCVYVLRRPDGHFYAGSTDALYDRIRAHRQRTGRGGPDMALAYLSLGRSQDAAAQAKAVESAAIRELQRRGFPLVSATDARRRHVASAGGGSGS